MKIVREEIQYFVQRAKCDCGGELIFLGQAYQQNGGPIMFVHQCDKCGQQQGLDVQYPSRIEVVTPCVEVSDFEVID